jgi:hypothetical protein
MLLKVLAFAGIVGICAVQGAMAQDLRGPRELPGPDYRGQQYVDSAGCVFLRAGINGRVSWVPRVDRQRRQLCGYPATGGSTRVATAPAVEAPAPAPAPVAVAPRRPLPQALGGPIDTVASLTTPPRITARAAAAPRPAAAPMPAPVAAPVAAPPPAPPRPVAATGTPGCPAAAPVGERRVLPDGRLALLCGRDRAQLAAFVARVMQTPRVAPEPAPEPVVTRVATAPATPGVGTLPTGATGLATGGRLICPAGSPVAQTFPLRGGGTTVLCTSGAGGIETAVAAVSHSGQAYVPVIPRGYKPAWEDDRLNPRRGMGTAEGQYAQDQVWTREVPSRLVSEATKGKKRVVVVSASNAPKGTAKPRVTTSTSTAPKAAVAKGSGRLYVQVGSFGVPSNAEGARARLAGMGLPVSGGRASIKGKPVQVVYAGPFASAAEAQAALSAARRAGFGDAFIR